MESAVKDGFTVTPALRPVQEVAILVCRWQIFTLVTLQFQQEGIGCDNYTAHIIFPVQDTDFTIPEINILDPEIEDL